MEAGWRRKLDIASLDGTWVTDDSVGLLLEQPRGPVPPVLRAGGAQ